MRQILFAAILALTLSGCETGPTEPPRASVVVSRQFGAKSFERVAIVVVNRTGVQLEQGTLNQIENTFTKFCIAKGYILATRSDVKQALDEVAFQHSGVTEEALAAKARILAVDAILLVSIDDISGRTTTPIIRVEGDRYEDWTVSVSAKLLSAEKAQVLVLADFTGTRFVINGSGIPQLIQSVAQIVAAGIPGQTGVGR